MVEAKSGSASSDNRTTDAATSGKNASVSATSRAGNGPKETTKSWTEELADGTITKKFFTSSSSNDSDKNSDDSSTLFGDVGSKSGNLNDSKAKSGGNGAVASAGKGAFAAVVNGKAVATAE